MIVSLKEIFESCRAPVYLSRDSHDVSEGGTSRRVKLAPKQAEQ